MSGDAAKETAEATGGHKASLEVPGTREVPATKSRHRKEVKVRSHLGLDRLAFAF